MKRYMMTLGFLSMVISSTASASFFEGPTPLIGLSVNAAGIDFVVPTEG